MRRRSWRDNPSVYQAALDACTPEQIAALDESDDENYIRKIATEEAERAVIKAVWRLLVLGGLLYWWLHR